MDDGTTAQNVEVQKPVTMAGEQGRPLTRKVQPVEDSAEALSP